MPDTNDLTPQNGADAPLEANGAAQPLRAIQGGKKKAAAKNVVPKGEPEIQPRDVLRNREARAFIAGLEGLAPSDVDDGVLAEIPGDWKTGPYGIASNKMIYISERDRSDGVIVTHTVILDGVIRIKQEITMEDGSKAYLLQGRNYYEDLFEFTLSAKSYSNTQLLVEAIVVAGGPKTTVRAGQEKHLRPAIGALTGRIDHARRFDRLGWEKTENGLRFLMGGREDRFPPHTTITLEGKIGAYSHHPDADLERGIKALNHLMLAQESTMIAVVVSAILLPPMALVCGWRNDRICTFVAGRTGAWKTTICQTLMCVWGREFFDDGNITKWTGTTNAIMYLAASTCDMPFLIDNFKPNVGKNAVQILIAMIQAILEGGEKDRLTRDIKLRTNRPVHAWPIITGEDVPDTDAASLARVLVVQLPPAPRKGVNRELTEAQRLRGDLPAVGDALLRWLESDEGQAATKSIGAKFEVRRTSWAQRLFNMRQDMQGVARVATSLTINELGWEIMSACPGLEAFGKEWHGCHQRGLELVARSMSERTAESLEAHKYLAAIRELLTRGKAILAWADGEVPAEAADRLIGWKDENGIYLLPKATYDLVEASSRSNSNGELNGFSKRTLHQQLWSLGILAKRGLSSIPYNLRIGPKGNTTVEHVLHLRPDALDLQADGEEDGNKEGNVHSSVQGTLPEN